MKAAKAQAENIHKRLLALDSTRNEELRVSTRTNVVQVGNTHYCAELLFRTIEATYDEKHDELDPLPFGMEVRVNYVIDGSSNYVKEVPKKVHESLQEEVLETMSDRIDPHFPDVHFALSWPDVTRNVSIDRHGTKTVEKFTVKGVTGAMFKRITRPDQDHAEFYVRTDMKAGGEYHEVGGMFAPDDITKDQLADAWSE